MLRQLLVTGLLLATLAGCSELEGRCTVDDECGEGGSCDMERGYCYAAGTEPEDTDGGACSSPCAEYEACIKGGSCRNRFTRLTIQAPSPDAVLDAGPVQVVARLEVNETYKDTTRFPGTLAFAAEQSAGGSVGTLENASHDDAGTYRILWRPPSAEAQITLTASHPVPDAGLSASVNVTVDGVPPVFTVYVPPFDAGVPDGGTTYGDPNAANSWPRDQQIPVEVRTNEANLEPGSVKVALKGTNGVAGPAVTVDPVTTGCDTGFCGVALLNLWEPTFQAFRGTMDLDVQGQDRAGNQGTVSPVPPSTHQVSVTRWKWAFSLPTATIKASPAVGEQGTIYVGTTANTQGMVLALKPDGTKKWEVPVGPVASLAVGAFDGGVESIYVAANTASNKAVIYALSSEDGGTRVRCPSGVSEHNGQVRGAMAVTMTGAVPDRFETGLAVVNNGLNTRLYVIRPEASGSDQCVASNPGFGLPETSQDGSLVVNGATVFYPTGTASIVSYTVFNSSLDWTASTGALPVYGLALTGTNLVGGASGAIASQGGIYGVSVAGGTAALLPNTGGGRVWNPIIGPQGTIAFFGQDTSDAQGDFKKYDLPNQALVGTPVSNVGVLRYAPALGVDNLLYTAASSESLVAAWSANDFSQRWSLPLGSTASSASVVLDCARSASGSPVPGKPGTLYVPAGGTLHAIIVDSPGLSQDAAAWPKFQHDVRNTGNPDTPITNCP